MKIRFVKCYVWSVLLYAMETWTLKMTDINRLEAFEMWIYRRLLKISWTDRISNEEVLRRVEQTRTLFTTVKRRKVAYLGHIMRSERYRLLQLIMQGKIEGRRGLGRKQISWLRNIREWTGIHNIGNLFGIARDRIAFRSIVQNMH